MLTLLGQGAQGKCCMCRQHSSGVAALLLRAHSIQMPRLLVAHGVGFRRGPCAG